MTDIEKIDAKIRKLKFENSYYKITINSNYSSNNLTAEYIKQLSNNREYNKAKIRKLYKDKERLIKLNSILNG